MKIIFLNRYFYPDQSATSQLLSDLAFHLAGNAREVHVITSRQRYDDASSRLPIEESVQNVKIHRVWTSSFGRGNLIGRSLDYLSFYISAAARLFLLSRLGDLVVAKTDPPMLSVIAALVVRIRGGRLINWLQDLFPELAIAAGLGWSKGVVGRTLAKIRDWSLRCAAQNVAIGDRMREALLARGIAAKQVTVIPNWADGESIRPVLPSDNRLRSAWGLEGKFVVGYSGNLGRAHEIDTLLGAMEILKSRSDIRFVFIGAGKQRQKLESECKNNGLMSVTFLPYQAREDLIWSLGVPDVHLVSLLPEMEGFVVPSKFYGIASAGRPTLFIGDLDGEIATALRQFDCGIAIRQGDAAGLAQAILRLQSDETLTAKLGANARKAFEAHWAKQIAFRAWVDTIERALKP